MSTGLLTTKFYFPPARANLVTRPGLVEQLSGGLLGALTLISAPAGYGKTTLLGEWRFGPGRSMPVAWLSLDGNDNDLGRFLKYLLAAFDQVQPGTSASDYPLLQSPTTENAEVILTTLLNTLEGFPQEFILVLDDYHLIENSAIHHALSFILDHHPPHLHLVVLTRSDPPLPLARLRARGQLTEIRSSDLRFSLEEASTFLQQVMGLSLSSQQVSALAERTEGWIAGLQLAAIALRSPLSMQSREDSASFVAAFSGSHQYIVDFLGEEVLNRQPEAVRAFLVKTSILERLTSSLCAALTGETDGQAMLERLIQNNLFLIPLDNEHCWYRYHHLFADLLHNRLRREIQPEEIACLHRHAADWYERNQDLFAAFNHALLGEDIEHAAHLLQAHFATIASSNRLPELIQLVKVIPESLISAHPRFCIFKSYVMGAQGKEAEVERYLHLAEGSLEGLVQLDRLSGQSLEYRSILAEIRNNQAGRAAVRGDFQAAASAAQMALSLADEDAFFLRSFTYLNLAYAYRETGQFARAVEKPATWPCPWPNRPGMWGFSPMLLPTWPGT